MVRQLLLLNTKYISFSIYIGILFSILNYQQIVKIIILRSNIQFRQNMIYFKMSIRQHFAHNMNNKI